MLPRSLILKTGYNLQGSLKHETAIWMIRCGSAHNVESTTVTVGPSIKSRFDRPVCWVIIGVSGCGKSTVGRQLANALDLDFFEGDDAHSAANIEKMASGQPLNDADRHDWLISLTETIRMAKAQGRGLVLSCSALKIHYRTILRSGNPDLFFVHLHGEKQVILPRLHSRNNHFMPPALLDSQFADLEMLGSDEKGITLNVAHSPEELVQILVQILLASQSDPVSDPISCRTQTTPKS